MSRIVGVDCGTTLRKYAWRKEDGSLAFWTTEGGSDEQRLLQSLIGECCIAARIVGIGKRPHAEWIEFLTAESDLVIDEVRLQAEGVRWLLEEQGLPHDEFLVVSVGTGTSYATYSGGRAEKLPFGNPLGGGFIKEHALGAPLWFMADLIEKSDGESLDLLYKHVFPDKVGTIQGEFVISHFARKVEKRSAEQYFTSVLNTVAVAVIRDLLMYRATQIPRQAVFIGTCITVLPPLASLLKKYAEGLGFIPVVPANGRYSAAIGALLEVEAKRAVKDVADENEEADGR